MILINNGKDYNDGVGIDDTLQHNLLNGAPLQYPCLENPMDRGDW